MCLNSQMREQISSLNLRKRIHELHTSPKLAFRVGDIIVHEQYGEALLHFVSPPRPPHTTLSAPLLHGHAHFTGTHSEHEVHCLHASIRLTISYIPFQVTAVSCTATTQSAGLLLHGKKP